MIVQLFYLVPRVFTISEEDCKTISHSWALAYSAFFMIMKRLSVSGGVNFSRAAAAVPSFHAMCAMPLRALQHQSLIRGRRRRLSRNKQKMHVVQFRQGHAFCYMRLKAKAGQGSLEMVDMLCCGRWLIQYRSRPRSSCIHIHIIVGTVRSKTWTSVWHGRRARGGEAVGSHLLHPLSHPIIAPFVLRPLQS